MPPTKQPTIILGYGATDPGYLEPARTTGRHLHRDLSHAIVIPTRGAWIPRCSESWMSMVRPPNQKTTQLVIERYEVGAAYNQAIQMMLDHPELSRWRYVVTLEEDNLVPPFGLVQLLDEAEEGQWDVLGGLYWTKGETGVAQIWGDRSEPINFRPQRPVAGQVVPCWGTGMGFTAFRLDQFRRMDGPWFETLDGKEGRGVFTQDLAYFRRAHDEGLDLKVGVHCGITVGHMDGDGRVW